MLPPPSDEAASKGRPADPGPPKGSRRSVAPAMARLRLPRRTLPDKAKCAHSNPHQLPPHVDAVYEFRSRHPGVVRRLRVTMWRSASGLRSQLVEIKYRKPTRGAVKSLHARGRLPHGAAYGDFFSQSQKFNEFKKAVRAVGGRNASRCKDLAEDTCCRSLRSPPRKRFVFAGASAASCNYPDRRSGSATLQENCREIHPRGVGRTVLR